MKDDFHTFHHGLVVTIKDDTVDYYVLCKDKTVGKYCSHPLAKVAEYYNNGETTQASSSLKGCPFIEYYTGMSDFGAYRSGPNMDVFLFSQLDEKSPDVFTPDSQGAHKLELVAQDEYLEIRLDGESRRDIYLDVAPQEKFVWEIAWFEEDDVLWWKKTGKNAIIEPTDKGYDSIKHQLSW